MSLDDRMRNLCPFHSFSAPKAPAPLRGRNAIKLSGRTFLAPHRGNAVKLSKILIAHASNSVCFFNALSLPVNNKIKKLVK